jgi:squalene-associated FAD-dependent desaturase
VSTVPRTVPRVVVVGGGLAGLAAALRIADATHGAVEITLLERRPRLGGATWSFERGGTWFDNGQHVFLRCCHAYRGFLERLGVADQVVLQDRLAIPVVAPGGRRAWLRRGAGPAPLHLARSLLAYRHLSMGPRIRAGVAMRALAKVDPDDPRADSITFGEWLRAHGQSDRAIECLWDVVTRPTVNLPAAEASLAVAAMVFRTGLLTEPNAADLGWSRVPLARLHEDAAVRALERAGIRIRRGVAVEAIEPGAGAGAVRAVHIASATAGGERLEANAVVLAVPHDAAAALLPPGAVEASEQLTMLGTSPIVNVHVVYDRPVTDLAVAAAIDSPVEWVFDRTEAAGLDRGQCLAMSISAAEEQIGRPPAELVATYTGALGDLFPAARDARVLDAVVTREAAATFRAAPGSGARRPPTRTGVAGLFLAGAWTDTGWPATMEGAVRSGLAAAAEVAEHVATLPGRRAAVVPG